MICGGTILIAFAVNLLWTGFLAASLPISTGPAASPRAQVMYMLEKPLQFAKIVFNYTFDNLPGNILAMFGSLIVWHEVTLPVWVIVLLWATLLFAALTDKPAAEIKAWRKAGVFVLSACVYVLIIASLYISFSALKSNIVQGMQPRYMFPLLLPLLLILKRKKEWKINITAVYIPISALALAVLDIAMYTRFV